MNIPCDKALYCPATTSPGGVFEWPIQNFSSEAPDKLIYVGVGFGTDPGGPPLGTIWSTPSCVGWCQSDISQEDADLCAAREQYLCQHDLPPDVPPATDGQSNPTIPPVNPPGSTPPKPPNQGTYYNTDQRCSFACPDGSKNEGFIAAGTVVSDSVDHANAIAQSLACKQVKDKLICIPKLNLFSCADEDYSQPEYSYQVSVVSKSPLVSLTASGLPPEITMSNTGLISGTPTTPGDYSFTITATTQDGNSKTVASDFHVLGITDGNNLPDAKVDHTYNHTLNSGGGGIDYFITDGSLPSGMTMSIDGIITGTCAAVGNSYFTVTVRDAFLNECSKDFVIAVTGPKFLAPFPPTPVVQCSACNFQYTTSPAAALCTFSGTLPPSLKISAHGLVTGNFTSPGTYSFVVTANDGTHSNTHTDTVVVTASGSPIPTAVKDFTYSHTTQDAFSGATTALSAAGGSYAWSGRLLRAVPGGLDYGQAGDDSRVLHGFTTCDLSKYDIYVKVDWNFNTNDLAHVYLQMQITFAYTAIVNLFVHANGPGSSGLILIPQVNWGSLPVAETATLLHILLDGSNLVVGQAHTGSVNVTITPATPPPPP